MTKIVRKLGVCVALLAVSGIAVASEYYGTVFGGVGGTEFEQVCNTGSMSGVRVRAGSYIDGIGTRCYKDSPVNSEIYGGPGGSLTVSDCPGSTPYVKGIRGRNGTIIDRFGVYCTDAAKISATGIQQFGGGGGTAFSYTCANGYSVKGLQGASGKWLDRIGAVCSNRSETSSGL